MRRLINSYSDKKTPMWKYLFHTFSILFLQMLDNKKEKNMTKKLEKVKKYKSQLHLEARLLVLILRAWVLK